MQEKRAPSIVALVGALIAGLVAISSAYIGWLLVDQTYIGWALSRGISFAALIVGVVSLLLLVGGFETAKEQKTV